MTDNRKFKVLVYTTLSNIEYLERHHSDIVGSNTSMKETRDFLKALLITMNTDEENQEMRRAERLC